MKKITLILVAFISLTAFTRALSTWQNDKAHSQLGFTVTHLGLSEISGTFNDFDVTIKTNKDDFSDASFELTAKIASVDTRIDARDKHLRSADFFDAEKYPELTYKSTSIIKESENKYLLTGDLNLHGIKKQVTMHLTYNGTIENAKSKKKTSGFQLTGVIKRSDFNVGPGFAEAMISDEVRIKADGEFKEIENK